MPLEVQKRTGFGSAGSKIAILVNCFEVTRIPDALIQHYDVNFSDDQVKEKRVIIQYLIEKEMIFGPRGVSVVYDGRANLYIPGQKAFDSQIFEVSEAQARGKNMRPDKPIVKNLKIKISHAAQVNMMSVKALAKGDDKPTEENFQAVNAMNIAIKHAPYGEFPNRKNNFYLPPGNPNEKFILGGGLEAWAGYFSSIRPGISRIVMNFDRGAGAFKQSGNVIEVCLALIDKRDPRMLEISRMPPREALRVQRFLKGCVVQLQLSRNQEAKYKIRKVSNLSAAEFRFETEPGRSTTVAQYIESKYGVRLQHPYLPCVQLTKIAWYPLEFVKICPGAQFFGKLNPDQVTQMLKFTTMRPEGKLNALRQGLRYMKFGGQSETLRAWNLDVKDSPMQVTARMLEAPKLHYADTRTGQPAFVDVKQGTWDVRGKKGHTSPAEPVARWFVVIFADERAGRDSMPRQNAQQSISGFVQGCEGYGIRFANKEPFIYYAGNCRESDVFNHIKEAAKRGGFGKHNPPQLVVTYVLQKTSRQYPYIKQACDTAFGVPSQNMVIQNVMKQHRGNPSQYYGNVALKINVKLKGVNQIIAKPVKLPGLEEPTIIFGADVTHPGPGSVFPSIAAVVASCDTDGATYATAARVQHSREEIIKDLKEMAMELIANFGRRNQVKPARIIFFRDGVSEGQFDTVMRDEVAALKAAIDAMGKGLTTKITYIICGKRHHVRFFATNPRDAHPKNGNLWPGIVVDNDIAHPYYSDFYLLSHAGLLGTSRPTHYSVLIDENNLGMDKLQKLSYWLAHLYPRSTRSVSIAAPAYFAHHLATRAKMYIGGDDDGSSDIGSGATPDQIDQLRLQKYEYARQNMKTVLPDLANTFYFM